MAYDVTVSNVGDYAVDAASLMLRVPPWVSFNRLTSAVPASTSQIGCTGGSYALCAKGAEVYWDLGSVAPGATTNVQVTAMVAADVPLGSLIQSTVRLGGTGLVSTVRETRTAVVVP